MSVLGLDSGYTVKYNPLPSGKGLYLTEYASSRPNTDTLCVSFVMFFLTHTLVCIYDKVGDNKYILDIFE